MKTTDMGTGTTVETGNKDMIETMVETDNKDMTEITAEIDNWDMIGSDVLFPILDLYS